MANILSQDEIDDLLGAMERGELVDDEAEEKNSKKLIISILDDRLSSRVIGCVALMLCMIN